MWRRYRKTVLNLFLVGTCNIQLCFLHWCVNIFSDQSNIVCCGWVNVYFALLYVVCDVVIIVLNCKLFSSFSTILYQLLLKSLFTCRIYILLGECSKCWCGFSVWVGTSNSRSQCDNGTISDCFCITLHYYVYMLGGPRPAWSDEWTGNRGARRHALLFELQQCSLQHHCDSHDHGK